jgi:hypothetical protein
VIAADEIAVVLRGCGERTAALAEEALVVSGVRSGSVLRTSGGPFEQTIRETFEFGRDSGRPLTLSVDADVVVSPPRLADLLRRSELPEGAFSAQATVLCKFFGGPRLAGNRLYRNACAPDALRLLPEVGDELRPESALVALMAAEGRRSMRSATLLGVHDYAQHPRDVFRKAAVQARKHLYLASYLLPFWEERAASDVDFAIALRGFAWGLAHRASIGLDGVYADLAAVDASAWDTAASPTDPVRELVLADVDRLIEGWRPTREFVRWFPERISLRTARTDPSSRSVRAALGWGVRRAMRRT